ncbi:class A beta-lactamase [Streptomyces sp. M92]|uniref:class A beta-lactamase n=1 Tax=Streptomyces sp. M92 TaxID=2944250 RepID=UPI00234A2C40|nr:class A beta-lactamase [Streptomyces sp. M92]WCN03361.1 class A beta-lactamase [Streptomyces sp. M92]
MSQPAISRRAFLGAAAVLSLAGCTKEGASASPTFTTAGKGPASSVSPSATPANRRHERLVQLEREFDARLGVYALATGTGRVIAHRADERFAFCSTFKGLAAAAVLDRNPISHLGKLVSYTSKELMPHSPLTRENVDKGMTIRQLCDAAVRYSDGTAGNLLVRELGGPGEITAYARSLGDTVTRMDRVEPEITQAVPNDPRDTSSPRAMGSDYRKILLGNALSTDKRAFLRDLMERNTTGDQRVRAGLPKGWRVADKTGTGQYGTLNDIAVVWPPGTEPLIIAIMSSKAAQDAERDQALLAETAAYVARTLL